MSTESSASFFNFFNGGDCHTDFFCMLTVPVPKAVWFEQASANQISGVGKERGHKAFLKKKLTELVCDVTLGRWFMSLKLKSWKTEF